MKNFILSLIVFLGLTNIAYGQGLVIPQDWDKLGAWDTKVEMKSADPLPKRWDWNDYATLQPIRQQGGCGSCWSFASNAVMESLHILLGMQPSNVDFAEQTAVSCAPGSYGCSGGFFTVFDYYRNKGLPLEKDNPYRAINGTCRDRMHQPVGKITRWAYVGNAYGAPATTEALKKALVTHGPLAIAIHGRLPSSRSVVTQCGSNALTHMVTIEGYTDDPAYARNGGGYWKIRNSWGAGWGAGGYMYLAYNQVNTQNKCFGAGNIAAYAVVNGVEDLREHLGL